MKTTHPATTESYVQEGLKQLNSVEELSVFLNEMIEAYEKEYNANIRVSNVGFMVDSIKYEKQQKLQLFNILPLNN